MAAKRVIEICSATMDDLTALLPRRDSRLALLRQAAKLEHWKKGESLALDARVFALQHHSIFELMIDDTFGFSHGIRIAFCEDEELQLGGTVWLLGMRRENESLTQSMIEVLRLRREMTIS